MSDLESTLAIDFGTTNSVVYVYKDNNPMAVFAGSYNTNQQGSTLFPSYVEYSKNGVIVGGAAKRNFRYNKYVVAAVKRIIGLSYTEYENLKDKSIFGCKVRKGQDGYPRFVIDADGNTKSPVEVASEIFKVLKKAADDYTNRNYTKAYVTVPANFKDHQCRAIKEAARLAGLEVLKLITEPTAAAMSWCFDHPEVMKSGERLMVYDFGGGTFDVSILECIRPNQFRIINTGGNPNLGGNDLDTALMNYMIEKAKVMIDGEIRMTPWKMNILRQECETAKIMITNGCYYDDNEGEFLIKNVKIFESIDFSEICYDLDEIDLTPRDLNKAIDSLVNKTIEIPESVITRADLMIGNIKHFLLVGGSSHLHLIKQRIKKRFFCAKFHDIDPDEAVAKGAMSLLINDKTCEGQVEEKIVISYGLQTSSNEIALILKKGDSIPAYSNEVAFTNTQDNQKTIETVIYQWDGEPSDAPKFVNNIPLVPLDNNCTRIENLSFVNPFPKPKGKQNLVMLFHLDVGGTLEVICKDTDENEVLASRSYGAVYGGSREME